MIAATLVAAALTAGPASAQAPDPGGDPDASVPVPPPDRYFGLNEAIGWPVHDLSPQQLVGLGDTAGANAIRTILSWQAIEPERDRWSDSTWRPYDELYTSAQAAGIRPILILSNAPWWARTLLGKLCLSNNGCSYPPSPDMDGEWAQFAAEAARRYPDAIFEIWNEPNLSGFWESGPDPERYARLQVLAYDAIKRVAPDAMVLSAGFANVAPADPLGELVGGLLGRMSMREFVRRAYSAPSSIKGHIDALAFHPFPDPPRLTGSEPSLGPGSGYARGFADIRAVRDAAGDSGLPLFVTETGISTLQGVSRAGQAVTTRRIYRKTLTMPDVIGVVFHRLLEPANHLLDATEAGFAWLRPAGSGWPQPWPVYCDFVIGAGNSYQGC